MVRRFFLVVSAAALLWGVPTGVAVADGCLKPGEREVAKRVKDLEFCLKASRPGAGVGRTVTFTAEINARMEKGERRIVIVDATLSEPIGVCANERVCTIRRVEHRAGVHKYGAVVAGLRGVPEDKLPRANKVRVLWLNVDIELFAYAQDREPDSPYPALLCDPEFCGTNTVGLGTGVAFYVKANRRLPIGVEMTVESNGGPGLNLIWRAPGGELTAACLEGDGCEAGGFRSQHNSSQTFFASLYLARKDGRLPPRSDRLLSSNRVEMAWKDWTPAVTFDQGPRTCNPSGQSCVYANSTLSATVLQPLDPGVVVILYMAKNCVPQPGHPAGDPGCPAYSPKDCSPPSRVCTYTGSVAAGYQPGAMVVNNGPRPMLAFGLSFLPALP